jgi:hypothetical protein
MPAYIRRTIKIQRGLEISGRAALLVSKNGAALLVSKNNAAWDIFAGVACKDSGCRSGVRAFVQEEVLPVIAGYWRARSIRFTLLRRIRGA